MSLNTENNLVINVSQLKTHYLNIDYSNKINKSVSDQNKAQNEESNTSNELKINQSFNNCFVIFGNYVTKPKSVDFETNGIRFLNVAPNHSKDKYEYHILIPFIDMNELTYSYESSTLQIFIKPEKSSFDKIKECLFLENNSENDFKYSEKSNLFFNPF
jgi:hypothetical protein